MDTISSLLPICSAPEPHEFWEYLERLVAASRLVIDRPRGSPHPRYPEMIYPYDYGYLDGTHAMDGGGIDVWVGSLPGRELDAVIISVDLKKRDAELKLLLGCTGAEKQSILAFMNDNSMRVALICREAAHRLLGSRRSVRRFADRPVPGALLERILEAATRAPSAHNRQPWRFVILASVDARQRLASEMGAAFRRDLLADGLTEMEADTQVERSRRRILEAPACILLCLDASAGDRYPDPARRQAEYLMGVQSVAMAGENLLLAAHAEGLGGVWVCAPLFAGRVVQQALELPENWQPQGLVFLGYPGRIPEERQRRPLSEVTRTL